MLTSALPRLLSMKLLQFLTLSVILSACAVFQQAVGPGDTDPGPENARPVERPGSAGTEIAGIGGTGQSAASLDRTTAAERAAATQTSTRGSALGQTVASLGDPTETGFWMKTPLVSSETPGRVQAQNGQSVQVTLIPIDGPASAGSRLSLSAMRALGLGLTDLPTVSVFRG